MDVIARLTVMAVLSKPVRPPSLPLQLTSQKSSLLVIVFTALFLRSRIVGIPSDIAKAILSKVNIKRKKLSQDEILRALQQLYVIEPDGSRTLVFPVKDAYVKKVRLIH